MKVLLVNKYLHPKGGAETYVFMLGKSLQSLGHDVEYFGMDNEKRVVGNRLNEYVGEIDFHKRSLHQLTYPFRIIYSLEAKRKITKVLYDFKPDIVHLNNFNYQLTPSVIDAVNDYKRKTGANTKIVFTAHDYQLLCPNHMMNNPNTHENCEKCRTDGYFNCIRGRCIHGSLPRSVLGAIEGRLYRFRGIYQFIDCVIAPSEFMKTKMEQDPVFAGKVQTMHNFVNPIEAKDCKKEDYVLFFGRFSPEKGIDTLVKVCKRLPDINFVFAGGGDTEYSFDGVPNIKNVGFKRGEELRELIARASFSVIPSEWYENCPFSVIESILLKTPVLGARIGGIPELIDEGKTGAFFESGNAEDLYEKIKAMHADKGKLEEMSRCCGEKTFESAASYTGKLVDCYQRLLDGGQ